MAFAGLLVLAACAVDDPSSAPTSTSTSTSTSTTRSTVSSTVPDDVEMFFDYPRYLWHLRRLSVATTNLGDEPISIRSIAVRTDHFEPLPAESKRTVIAPGQRIDVQVDFGELTTCDPSTRSDAAVLIEIARGDADPVQYLATLDPAPLDEIRDRECAQRRVTDAATIGFSAEREIDGSTMSTTIDVVRNAGTPTIELTSLSGSVIFALTPVDETEPIARLDADDPAASIPILVEVTRCDPHVVSQSSRTFDLAVYVSIDGADTHRQQLEVGPALQAELQSMIDHCAARLADD